MKRLTWMIVILSATMIGPARAQDGGPVLQVTAPFFAEDILLPVLEQYEADNPGVQVQLVTYQGFGMPVEDSDDPEAYLDNLAAYFSSADVLLVDSGLTPEATRANYVLDLSPLTQSDPSYNEANFHPALLRSFQWDGGQWALPISTSFVVISYIPEAFDAAGLAYPSASWTLADLDNAARTLTQYNADGSIAMPGLTVQGFGGGSIAPLFLSLLGQGVYSEAAFPNNPDFSNPQLETYLDTWLQMVNDGLLNVPEGVDNDDIPMTLGTPFGFGGGPFGGQDETERATALLPGGRAGLNVSGYAVSRGTLYPEAAYDLITYLINNPAAVTVSLGTVPAVQGLDTSEAGGPGGGPGFFANALVPEELEPLIPDALAQGIPLAESRFSDGIDAALSLMEDEGLDARSALDQAWSDISARLTAADARATAAPITVAEPEAAPQLAAGEISLNFAILGGGGPGGGFAVQEQWQTAADAFAADDPEVGFITLDTANQNQLEEVTQNFDCFYANTNLVPDADLAQLLNLDPFISTDSSLDPDDFIRDVFDQVQANNQTWALPLQLSPLVLRFDYDIYNVAGVTPPQGSWTVAEFEDSVRQIKVVLEEGQTPVELNVAAQSSFVALIAAYGGLPFDTRTDPPTVNFTDPATMDAIQQVLDLVADGYISYTTGPGGGGAFLAQADDSIPIYSNALIAFGFGGNNAPPPNTDGIVTFPRGAQFNAVPVNLGTAYISATTRHAEACYRFIVSLSGPTDLFQSMPARRSVMNSPELLAARGAETVALFNALADLMEQPTTILVPTNINAGNFGMTNWLFAVFDRYIAGEVVDLEAELRAAEQTTRDYLVCLAAIPPLDPAEGNPQTFFEQVQACQTAVDPGSQ